MKKILLTCMMMLLGWSSYAQIIVNEGFEGSATPTGFVYTSFSRTTVSPRFCNGTAAVARNFWSSGTAGNIVYSSTASNATAMNVSFNFKALEYGTGTGIGGTFKAEYSVDGGTTYTQLGSDIVLSAITPCTAFTNVIPAGTIPAAASFKFRISGTWTSGDYYFMIDDVQLAQTATSAPACTAPTAPLNAAINVSVTPSLAWGASAGTSAYLLNLGTTPGGTNVLNAYNAGTSTSYSIPVVSALMYSTTYYFSVSPSNNIGTATGCTQTSFTTLAIPCPTVSAPVANATNQSLKPTITWSAVTGATGYKLSVGTTAGGTDILSASDLGNVTSYTFPTNLNVSTTYFYTVTSYQGANASTGCTERKFTTGATAPPANDECSGAITMTVNPDLACGSIVAGNTLGATQSMAATPCFGNPDDDVWFKFVATNAVAQISLTNVVSTGTSTTTDMYFQVLSGVCGTQTSLLCSDPDTGIVSGLTVGTTYYVRVYTYSSGSYNASFNICVGTPPPPPGNDDCAAAVALTVNADYSCGSVTAGTTVSATQSTETAPSCASSGTNDDVWYKFTATNTAHRISLTNVTGGTTDMAMAIYSGACGSLVAMQCSDPETMNVTGLTVGTEYKVRVWTYTSTASTTASFNICVGTEPPPPTCLVPTALISTGATVSTIDMAWTAPATAPANGYEVYYSTTNTAPTAATVLTAANSVTSATTTATISGLSNSTTYFIWVRSNCSAADKSTWAGPTSITTVCGATTVPYTQDFSSATIPNLPGCTSVTNDGTGNVWTVETGSGYTGNVLRYRWNTGSAANTWFFTQGIQMDAGTTYYIGYKYGANGFTEKLKVAIGTANNSGAMTTLINDYPSVTGSTVNTVLDQVFVPTVSGVYYLGFQAYSAADQFYLFVDDITVTAITLATGESIVKENGVNIYPNPFTDFIRISDVKDVVSVSIVDMSGRMVKTVKPANEINLSSLKSGMYLINLKMKDGSVKTVKSIKK